MNKLYMAIVFVLGLILLSSIPGLAQQGDVIHACVSYRDGNLRIVESETQCNPRKEWHLSWNQAGSSGEPGTPCWDLNQNGSCDTETEDRDGDLDCDAMDCQGAIHAFDSSEPPQYLGIYLGGGEIFIKNLQAGIWIVQVPEIGPAGFPGHASEFELPVSFTELDCPASAIPYYVHFHGGLILANYSPSGWRYFKTKGAPPIHRIFKSRAKGGFCENKDWEELTYELDEVTDDIPFTLPVTLLLVYR